MLEEINLSKKLDKKEYKLQKPALEARLAALQRECRRLQIPVMVVFEGWGASGKGTLINNLILPLDPRGFSVYTIKSATCDEQMRPFLWRFWTKTPPAGRMAVFDRSWYRRVMNERVNRDATPSEVQAAYAEISSFEEQLTQSGVVMIKFFLHISEQEQKKRLEKLEKNTNTAWRVTEEDWENHRRYAKFLKSNDEMLEKTDTSFAPWTIVEANDEAFATVKIMSTVINRLAAAVAEREARPEPEVNALLESSALQTSILSRADLSKTISKDEYRKRLSACQKKLAALHNQVYRKRIPVVIVFEGQDAAGKGGAIRRLTQNLDPRGYAVYPTAAPSGIEKEHHYLWRFWNTIPKAGHIAIYDRSWYGRVMVERIEGFCSVDEWQRAYKEINEMERHLVGAGAVVIKFWLQIDSGEQEKRFTQRMENPEKQWKITDEDWRNRAKWDEYCVAVDEMLVRTSTSYAPWTIVEANQKQFARIKVLEKVISELEHKINEQKES